MRRTRRLGALGLILWLGGAAPGRAQAPAGPVFQVNTYTYGFQNFATVATDPGGGFLVVWESDQPGNVVAQLYDATGGRRGAEFLVPTYTTMNQGEAHVAMDARGRFVAVWATFDGPNLVARRFEADGTPRGPEFTVRTLTAATIFPRVASDAAGNFVVVWDEPDGGGYGIGGQRYDLNGVALGSEFQVNSYTTDAQLGPAVASDADGNFVVAWSSYRQDGSTQGVFAQRFDATGARRGAEFRVNTYTLGDQVAPALASDARGAFVVAWESEGQDGSMAGIFARRYDAQGVAQGAEFRVNTYTTFQQVAPSVAMDAAGDFLLTWTTATGQSFFDPAPLLGQRYDSSGVARGGEFRITTYTSGIEAFSSARMDAVGNAVVAWEASPAALAPAEIFGRRLGGLLPTALSVDASGNRVWEPGETVEVKPAWRNVNGTAQTFAGTLSGLTGPAGATYAITDGAGSYGTVANGSSAACTDCYGVSVSAPSSRPALHWDATAVERLSPDTQGQAKIWALHVGGSFADVAGGSAFYPFVETLLHHGVTAGCGGGNYCPADPTARDQMAVFVLLAKEGAGYTPPPCTTPVFVDVPASSGFCRYVEELARRGVVNGCGGGNYCPADPVTREQMAVFTLRTLDPALNPPACTTPVFADVPAASPFCKWIEELARRGVVTGCGGDHYCPTGPVTREQMGVFIGATFGLTLYGP